MSSSTNTFCSLHSNILFVNRLPIRIWFSFVINNFLPEQSHAVPYACKQYPTSCCSFRCNTRPLHCSRVHHAGRSTAESRDGDFNSISASFHRLLMYCFYYRREIWACALLTEYPRKSQSTEIILLRNMYTCTYRNRFEGIVSRGIQLLGVTVQEDATAALRYFRTDPWPRTTSSRLES